MKDQFKELGCDKNSKQMSLMHLNISSLPYHIDELTNLLNKLNTNFKIIGITESRLTSKKGEINSIELSNYNIEHTPTKSDKGGALLFISKHLNYKNRSDFKIYQDKTLKSVFVKIISETQKKTILQDVFTNTQNYLYQILLIHISCLY